MKIKVKKHSPDAVIPQYAHDTDAGLDLTAISKRYDSEGHFWEYDTGLSIEIPKGYVGLVFPRSSISKTDLFLTNAVGVIDSGYRGTIKARFKPTDAMWLPKNYELGERIVQLIIMPYPKVELQLVEELDSSDRGTGGFGSSGK